MKPTFLRWARAGFAVLMLALLGMGVWSYRAQHQLLQQDAEVNLRSIAQLKVDQIDQWRNERLNDIAELSASPFFLEAVANWRARPSPAATEQLLARFRVFIQYQHYQDVTLMDTNGQILLDLNGDLDLSPDISAWTRAAIKRGRPMLSDLHTGPDYRLPHLNVIAPLKVTRNGASQVIGAVILKSDARKFLYPLLQSWPVHSASAETLLVRRDGNEILFLNDLRLQPDTALKLRIPWVSTNTPPWEAALGRTGIFYGEDYRGVPVMAVSAPIPDSPWFMVAKVDAAEAFAVWHFRAGVVLALIFGCILAAAASVALIWRRQTAFWRYTRSLIEACPDPLVAISTTGIITDANAAAETATGIRRDQLIGTDFCDCFTEPEKARAGYQQVLETGGLRDFELQLRRAGGPPAQVVYNASVYRDELGNVAGIFAAVHDLTRRQQAEAALRQSQERYALAERATQDGLWDWNIITGEEYFSARYQEMIGLQNGEMPGRKSAFLDRLHPDDRPDIQALTAEHLATGRRYAVEFRLRHKDGRYRWMFSRGEAVRDAAGRPVRMVGATTDITDRKQAGVEMQRVSRWLVETQRISRVGGWMFNLKTSEVWVSLEARRIYGVSEAAPLTLAQIQSLPLPQYRPQLDTALRELLAGKQSYDIEFQIKRANDGAMVDIHSVAEFNADEATVQGVISDITERKRAEAQVHLQFSALSAAANAIAITDRTGRIEWVNPSFTKLTGYSAEEAIGGNLAVLKSGQHPPAFYATLWATITTGNVWQGELVNKRKDGRLYTEEMTITPVRDAAGEIAHFVAIKQDVTERRQLENQLRQSQKMEAIGQLAGGVAHDFNNLLSSMLMQTELIEMIEPLPDDAREGLKQIRADVNRAADLTRQLLLFSRRQVMQRRNLDLNDAVTNLAKMLQRIIGEDVRLQLNLHPAPLMICADAGMVDQVLMNLAINARDAMPKGGQLRIDTTAATVAGPDPQAEAAPGRYVCLSVSDTGSGIPPEILPKIFEPFFTTKEAGKGTGLGLATVFGIVKQHQGWIQLDNRPGHGLTFQVYLPARLDPTAEMVPSLLIEPQLRGGGETILLVEDESGVRKLVRTILERRGYQVVEAVNGVEALRLWPVHHDTVAVLVTDLVMPGGLSGQELARQLVASQPRLKVIFMSGYSAEIAGRELQLRRGESFIQKPFAPDQFLATIRRSLADLDSDAG